MNRRWLPGGAAALTLFAVAAAAASVGNAELISSRIANFREMGAAAKNINDELRGQQPNFARIREAATLIKSRGAQMLKWFSEESKPEIVAEKGWLEQLLGMFGSEDDLALPDETKTNAKIEAWTQRTQFEQGHRNFLFEAERFEQAAQTADKVTVAARFLALRKTCQSCHDKFRTEID